MQRSWGAQVCGCAGSECPTCRARLKGRAGQAGSFLSGCVEGVRVGARSAGCAGVSDLGCAFVSRVFAGGCVWVRVPGVGWNPSDLHGPQSPSICTKERVAPEPACFALPCTHYSFRAAAFSFPSIAVLHFGGAPSFGPLGAVVLLRRVPPPGWSRFLSRRPRLGQRWALFDQERRGFGPGPCAVGGSEMGCGGVEETLII